MIDLIIGHPGTGKTTYVSKLIERDSAKYGSEGILVGSFTNTAAHELKGYNIIIKPEMIGTLHSHAYRAIGPGRNIADKMLDKFNEDNPDMPMSGGISPGDDGGFIVGKTDADAAYAKLQVLRNQQMPRELWRGIEGGAAALSFERRWNKFKADHDCIDFTDMIEIALRDTAAHPNNPSISYWDEFQDFTRLEIALIEKWSESMPNGMVVAGDANQLLYYFKGASPNYIIDLSHELPPEQMTTLNQSWRVPRLPQQYASKWITRAKRYIPANYEPKNADGFVRHATQLMLSEPYGIITDMQQYLSDGKTVAIQASCAYMLDPFKNALRAAAIPFHNPYRPERGDWNPLKPGSGLSASTRLLSFLRMSTKYHGEQADLWTYADVYNFASVMNATGNLKRGMKAKLDDWKKSQVKVTVPALLEVFTDEALSHMMDCDMPWYVEQVQKSRQPGMQFPLQIIAKGGLDAITKVPQVNIGTIHSFKGTQFDVVYIFPDLSMRMQIDMHNSHDARDAIIRMMYVGMTRCKEGLVLGGTINRGNFDFPRPEK